LPQLTEHGRQSPTLQDAQAGSVQNSSVATYTALVQNSLLTGMPRDVSTHVMALCLRPVPHVTEHGPHLKPSTHLVCVTDHMSQGYQANCLLYPHHHAELSYLQVAQKLAGCYWDEFPSFHLRSKTQMLL
jgi:hypothetical protein